MSILHENIDEVVTVWNTNCIRLSKNQNVPSGRPCVLYTMPLLYGTQDYATNELFQILMEENNLEIMSSPEVALNIYKSLCRLALQALYA
ncbi:hypothetical protein ACJMK2_025632 [Sinanodonta woodiana]|uniref:Uncharacterized protein n=1 Tax=Sinanodonta woodiana TaxID=1069815 RepID=A0ABD3XJ09_SINWO